MSSLSSSVLTLRIRTDTSDVEWSVRQDELTFGNAMFAISKVLPNVAVTAFEYEDDEGDRITVRTDEELQTMLGAYLEECVDGYKPVLAIYPRVGKTPQDRNIHGLKINTKKSSGSTPPSSERVIPKELVVSMSQSSGMSPSSAGPSSGGSGGGTMAGAGIQGIVGCGDIVDTDLRYIEVVGSGYSGTVYRAHHIPSNRVMAVKVLQLDITEEVQKEILSELRILDQCHSSCIINFYGAFFIENQFSICTEYMDGRSLDHYGKIPEPVLARMTVNMVNGLLYLWARKIMHRDIKPSNVLVNTKGQVKLCDFGVSTQLVNSIAKTYVGTYAYMAPERIKGEDYSLLAEVWSLGVSLFELATGRFPYSLTKSADNQVMMPLLNCIVNEPPPKLADGIFSMELVDLISKCMQRNPRSRLTPAALENHPFIRMHLADQDDIIAMWVQSKLKEIMTQPSAVIQR